MKTKSLQKTTAIIAITFIAILVINFNLSHVIKLNAFYAFKLSFIVSNSPSASSNSEGKILVALMKSNYPDQLQLGKLYKSYLRSMITF